MNPLPSPSLSYKPFPPVFTVFLFSPVFRPCCIGSPSNPPMFFVSDLCESRGHVIFVSESILGSIPPYFPSSPPGARFLKLRNVPEPFFPLKCDQRLLSSSVSSGPVASRSPSPPKGTSTMRLVSCNLLLPYPIPDFFPPPSTSTPPSNFKLSA